MLLVVEVQPKVACLVAQQQVAFLEEQRLEDVLLEQRLVAFPLERLSAPEELEARVSIEPKHQQSLLQKHHHWQVIPVQLQNPLLLAFFHQYLELSGHQGQLTLLQSNLWVRIS